MKKCKHCGSYAVNPGRSGRDESSDLDLCDVCYWRKRAEQAAEIEREAWKPIETAPRDGTVILLGSRGGCWIGKWLQIYGSGYRPENPWSSLMLNHNHMGEKWMQPTHWMPLPQPPRSARSAKGGE